MRRRTHQRHAQLPRKSWRMLRIFGARDRPGWWWCAWGLQPGHRMECKRENCEKTRLRATAPRTPGGSRGRRGARLQVLREATLSGIPCHTTGPAVPCPRGPQAWPWHPSVEGAAPTPRPAPGAESARGEPSRRGGGPGHLLLLITNFMVLREFGKQTKPQKNTRGIFNM